MRKLLIPALTLALCCSHAWPQEATRYEAAIRAARATSWNAITKGQGSGVSIAIMDKGKLVYSEGLGVRDRALNNPVDSHTRFNIGSTSKMFPAVAILLLVDEGKLSLDDQGNRRPGNQLEESGRQVEDEPKPLGRRPRNRGAGFAHRRACAPGGDGLPCAGQVVARADFRLLGRTRRLDQGTRGWA